MPTATLTSKGQITIPAAVRLALGLNAGDRIEFIQTAEGAFTIAAATNSVTALKGLVRQPSRPVSIEDMNKAIAERGASSP
jgi:antitoxin PrlF